MDLLSDIEALNSKQRKIIDGFLEVASREGMPNVTLSKIAKACKIPYATVHYYYGGKDDLLVQTAMAVITHHYHRQVEEIINLAAVSSEQNTLHAFLRAALEWGQQHRAYFSFWLYHLYEANFSRQQQPGLKWTVEHLIHTIQKCLLLEVGKGRYAQHLPIEEIAHHIGHIQLGSRILNVMDRNPEALETTVLRTIEAVERLIGSFGSSVE